MICSFQSLHQPVLSRESSPSRMAASLSNRSLSPDSLDTMEDFDGMYRFDSRKSSRSYDARSYESDYADQRFVNPAARHAYPGERERQRHHMSAALETRRRMFERDARSERNWNRDYSDSYSDVELKRRNYYTNDPHRGREREGERVAQYRRFFHEQMPGTEEFRAARTDMRRQSSTASQDSAYHRHYLENQFELHRSRFEVYDQRKFS